MQGGGVVPESEAWLNNEATKLDRQERERQNVALHIGEVTDAIRPLIRVDTDMTLVERLEEEDISKCPRIE